MNDAQLLMLLKFAVFVSPVAAYFLVLGLMNCQAHPRLVSGRQDFLTLTGCFCPLLAWMLHTLVRLGPTAWAWWMLGALLIWGVVAAFRVPRDLASWVVYNVSADHIGRLLGECFRKHGMPCRWDGAHLQFEREGIRVDLASFTLLRNVTIHIRLPGPGGQPVLQRVRHDVERSLANTRTLPNAVGGALLLIGSTMLILPITMMADHMETIVKIVHDYFS